MLCKEGKILVVDDEQQILELIGNMLMAQQYNVLTADTAEKALAIMSAEPIDIVISDESMPGMSGTDLLGIIRQSYPDTIAMMLTGKADLQTAIRAINEGQVYRFLTKPVYMADLLVSVDQALQHQKCIKEVNQLNRQVADQQSYIKKLESAYPGITEITRDESGAIVIEEN